MGTGSLSLSLSAKKRPGRGIDHRVPSSADVENGQNYKICLEPLEKEFFFFHFNIGELQNIFWIIPTMSALVLELELSHESVPTQQRERMIADPVDQ